MADGTEDKVEEAHAADGAEVAAGAGGEEDFAEDVDLGAVYDVPVEVSVVLGRTSMSINDLLTIKDGTLIELEKKVGEPVDVFINDRLVARGEVVIVEDNIGITMTEVIKAEKS